MKYWKVTDENLFYEQILKSSKTDVKRILLNKIEYYGPGIKIPKKNGERKIYSINKSHEIYTLQRNICRNFFNNIMMSDVAFGFVKGHSYLDYLLEHTYLGSNAYYLRIDIKNFFNSISRGILKDVLSYYFEAGERLTPSSKEDLLQTVIGILTFNNHIVQGAPTSPIISNLIFRQLDIRIDRYCSSYNIRYSRYADDLLFSSQDKRVHSDYFLYGISNILKDKKFEINYSKTIRSSSFISLGGYVVSDSVRLSRKKLLEISRVLFLIESKLKKMNYEELNRTLQHIDSETHLEFSGKYELCNYLAGNRAFIISVAKISQDEKFINKSRRIIERIEKILESMLN